MYLAGSRKRFALCITVLPRCAEANDSHRLFVLHEVSDSRGIHLAYVLHLIVCLVGLILVIPYSVGTCSDRVPSIIQLLSIVTARHTTLSALDESLVEGIDASATLRALTRQVCHAEARCIR